jgi:hypothetical protein
MDIMQCFGDATSLWISANKSSVAPIRCSEINLDEVLQNFDGDRVFFPITYLGLPVTLGQLKLVHLQPMIDRATSKMAGCQGSFLNIGGRIELVKTVLSSLSTYLLTSIKPPKQFYK